MHAYLLSSLVFISLITGTSKAQTAAAQATAKNARNVSIYIQPGGFIAVTNCTDENPGINLNPGGKIVLLGEGAKVNSKGCSGLDDKIVGIQRRDEHVPDTLPDSYRQSMPKPVTGK